MYNHVCLLGDTKGQLLGISMRALNGNFAVNLSFSILKGNLIWHLL